MIKKRCFLCGHKMAENGLCSNSKCVRSVPVPGSANAQENNETVVAKTAENGSVTEDQSFYCIREKQ